MEDVYTIKVKTKPDTRNVYPSERRYSASTVSGLAWVHIALAATSFLLACLALVNPNSDIKRLNINDTEHKTVNRNEAILNLNEYDENFDRNDTTELTTEPVEDFVTTTEENVENNVHGSDENYVLVIAPTLLTVFGLAAGIASIMASTRWYIDRNITWLFLMSVLSTLFAVISIVMVMTWFITTSEESITEFYKDRDPFQDYFVVKHSDVVESNGSHTIIKNNPTKDEKAHLFTKSVLSINILIAAFLELLWSILSVKISYKGMRNNYKDDSNERRGNCISVVTTIKGNNTKKLPRIGKMQSKSDLIQPYPSKIKRIFLAQNDEGFYLKDQSKAKQNTETSSEFYKERMMHFLNRCDPLEGISNSEVRTPSVQSDAALNPIPEVTSAEINVQNNPEPETVEVKDRMTPVSWGDTPEHTIYNQNTLNLEKLFKFGGKKELRNEKTEESV